MKSIAFFNNKGGVGKTTLLCNLAAYLSINNSKKILIIDADPQSNSTAYLLEDTQIEEVYNSEESSHNNIYQYYESVSRGKGFSEKKPFIKKSKRFKVDLLPGHPKFALREDLLSKDWSDGLSGSERGLQTTFTFKHLLAQFNEYDFIFVDMGPSLGAINRSIILTTDYFLTPMSVDLFSIMAIENIKTSLDIWKDDLESALNTFYRKTKTNYTINTKEEKWHVAFIGYVMQQYKTKSTKGVRAPVKSFDRVINKFTPEIELLEEKFGINNPSSACLGKIPNLSSLIPMSQLAKAPIFKLSNKDGVVGAHFAAVSDADEIYKKISEQLMTRLNEMEEKSK